FSNGSSTLAEERKRTKNTFVWGDMFRDAPMRKRFALAALIGFFTQWSGNALLSFYTGKIMHIVGINNPRTVQMIIFGWTCWGLVAGTSVATLISPRYPRRTMFLMGTIGTGLVYIVWTIANSKAQTGSPKAVIPVLVFMFLYTPFYTLGWGSLTYTYLSELFPYHQRSQGIAVQQLTGRIALFVNTYVNPIAVFNIGWKYYIVYCVWIAVEALTVYFFFPETKDRTLEELAFMWEGDEAWNKVRERMDEVMGHQGHELGPIPEEEDNAGHVTNERVVNAVTP
ncbi:hypothetical protein NEUTE1DRAFT_39023, partial [Neurospora tetrasperma FGSC 2508]